MTTTYAAGQPLAIIGMSCRYPGGISSPQELWQVLADGRHVAGPLPQDRGWDLERVGAIVERGGFLDGAAEFDAAFFGLSPREATAMDPQQRIALEVAWEALERAGIDPISIRGSLTGVFVGAESRDYGPRLHEASDNLAGQLFTGNAGGVLSGRISYTLDLRGPVLTVDTSASASLAALHLAMQSLRRDECDLALVGGASVMALPGNFVAFGSLGVLAADGRCRPFSEGADGTAWSEGAGMLVVETLDNARRNGHPVLAVLRGSAMNSDGASSGLTAPDVDAQAEVIRSALADAGLTGDQVDVVEAHGTGTPLGDRTEATALLETYGRDRDRPIWLGSAKANLGHTLAAAGCASVIKMVLALQHESLPELPGFTEPNRAVDWGHGTVRPLAEPVAWPAGDVPRRAGISGFGIGGTNVHVVMEEPPSPEPAAAPERESPVLGGATVAWPLSARDADSLAGQAGRLSGTAGTVSSAVDIAWSLATTRSVFDHRAVLLGDPGDLAGALDALVSGEPSPWLVTGPARQAGRLAFVFPGQGSQWIGMGRGLARHSRVFAERLAECDAAIAPYVDWTLDDALAGRCDFAAADVVQPALWAVMVSLAAMWQAAGVRPDAVVGHSQGEIAAAAVAGVLSLPDAARVVVLRSRALRRLAGTGGMLAIEADADTVAGWIHDAGDSVTIAAVNGPTSTVVSGPVPVLAELAAAHPELRTRMIPVDYASHGPLVDEVRDEVLTTLARIAPQPGEIPMVSSLTGQLLDGRTAGAEYWYTSLREPVRFAPAVRALVGSGHDSFIEVSPHPVLTGAVAETVAAEGGDGFVTGTLRRDSDTTEQALRSLATAHVAGVTVDWSAVLPAGRQVALPTYAFRKDRFWLDEYGRADVDLAETQLPSLPESPEEVLEFVRAHTAAVLGHSDPSVLPPHRSFKELGLDSVTAVELRTRLSAATGRALPVGLVFDSPTPELLAEFLGEEARDQAPQVEDDRPADASGEFDALAARVDTLDEVARARLADQLWELLSELAPDSGASVTSQLEAASDEDMFAFIEGQLGS